MSEESVKKFPLELEALKRMRASGITFLAQWPVEWFEEVLQEKRGTNEFTFSMLTLKQIVEEEDGKYLEQCEGGKLWRIPSEAEHEDIAKGFERKLRSYASRAMTLRNRVLADENANIAAELRTTMEKNVEVAAMRRILLAREKSVIRCLKEKRPKLLDIESHE